MCVVIVRHMYRDAQALHGQLAMYVLKQICTYKVVVPV